MLGGSNSCSCPRDPPRISGPRNASLLGRCFLQIKPGVVRKTGITRFHTISAHELIRSGLLCCMFSNLHLLILANHENTLAMNRRYVDYRNVKNSLGFLLLIILLEIHLAKRIILVM